jgi:predicted nucleic acid-binding protein
VVVYAYDGSDPRKQARAVALLKAGGWVVSTQVMQEFFVVTTRRLATALSPNTALMVLQQLALVAVAVDPTMVADAAATSIRSQLTLWDALIVRAAVHAGCERLLTEDLTDGQVIDGVVIENPF